MRGYFVICEREDGEEMVHWATSLDEAHREADHRNKCRLTMAGYRFHVMPAQLYTLARRGTD
jgi:hypothetical protein